MPTQTRPPVPAETSDPPRAETPLRLAVFTYSYLPMMTGISSLVHERIACLLSLGHSVRLFHPAAIGGAESSAAGAAGLHDLRQLGDFSAVAFPTVANPLRRSFPDAASHRVWDDAALLEQFSPDVLTVDEAAGLYGAASGWLSGYGKPIGVEYARQAGIPCVNLLQTDWQGYLEHYIGRRAAHWCVPAVRRMMRPVARGYDANLTPSKFLMCRNRVIYGGRVKHLAFHGVDCQRFSPRNRDLADNPHVASPLILSTGRLVREKNVWQLLEAFRLVQAQLPSARLVVLGRGPLLKKLRKAAREFGSRVVLPGAVFGDALRGWYARASVFWTASLTENFSASILESLASGTPVVAAAAGGNVEQVVDDVCGCLTPANDAPEMARRTIALLRDDRLRARMSHAARDRALELSVDTATARLVTCLRELIAGHACTASGQAVRTSPGIDRGNPEPQRLDALR